MVELQARTVAERFALDGDVLTVEPHGDGHINATYVVTAGSEPTPRCRYVLQRINRRVFRDPEAVIRNIERVTRHLRLRITGEGGDPERGVVRLIPTSEGGDSFVRDDCGEVWRCLAMIERASALSTLTRPKQARAVASAFGRFLRYLSDCPVHELTLTLPGLHATAGQLAALDDVVHADPLGRLPEAGEELAFIEARRGAIRTWKELLSSGVGSVRVIHNDTKVSNVLVDERSGRGVCVIDLDTVMPGSALIDIGDLARSVLTGPEDTGRGVDLGLFDAAIRGYLDETAALLAEAEIENIVPATRLIALELGIRFLVDYLGGDRWFPVQKPVGNLARSRVQLKLAREIEGRDDEMRRIVCRAVARSRRRRGRGPTTDDAIRFRFDGGRARR